MAPRAHRRLRLDWAGAIVFLLGGCASGEPAAMQGGIPFQPDGSDDAGTSNGGNLPADDGDDGPDPDDSADPDDDAAEPDEADGADDHSDDHSDDGDNGDASTSGASTMDSSTGDVDDSTDGGESSTGAASADPPGTQPSSGMWAACEADDLSQCEGLTNCVGTSDNGYCSVAECDDPAQDCDAAPAETSVTPICAAGGNTSVCALDCSTASCPTSMDCAKVSIDGGPELDICL
ncbi:MAG: hypothetical protein AAF721_29250 [Myxococcota bacterium]